MIDIQLLRSLGDPGFELAGDAHQHLPGFGKVGMQAAEGDRSLASMLGPAPDRRHQPRPAGNRLASCFGAGQTDKQTPPVVDQRHGARRQLAPMQVVRGEATPAPLVLQLVEGILRIGPVSVELCILAKAVETPRKKGGLAAPRRGGFEHLICCLALILDSSGGTVLWL